MTCFKKGDAVTLFESWDGRGTIRVTDLVVYACGKKRMILVDEAGEVFEGRQFSPGIAQSAIGNVNCVQPRMTSEAAEAFALELGAQRVAYEIAHKHSAVEHWRRQGYASEAYVRNMNADLDLLHEPRVIRYSKGA